MISDEKIQADIIAKLKAIAPTVSFDTTKIKEAQWQGDEFAYPAIRLDLENGGYTFDEQERCALQFIEFTVYFYSEERSSKECSTIKGQFENALTGLGWNGTYARYKRLRLTDNVSAFRESERVWRSQLKYITRIEPL